MITFFRKIRHRLLKESKLTKYLIYAFGEIILIVIGILLALQFNALKGKQNDKQVEKLVLRNIIVDLKNDTISCNMLIERRMKQISACQFMFNLFTNPDLIIKDTVLVYKNLSYPLYTYSFVPNKTAFEIAKGSGSLFKITNENLLALITSYFADDGLISYANETKDFALNFQYKILGKYLVPQRYHNINSDFIPNQNKERLPIKDYLEDLEMHNYYVHFIFRTTVEINMINGKKNKALELIKLIDNELKTFR